MASMEHAVLAMTAMQQPTEETSDGESDRIAIDAGEQMRAFASRVEVSSLFASSPCCVRHSTEMCANISDD